MTRRRRSFLNDHVAGTSLIAGLEREGLRESSMAESARERRNVVQSFVGSVVVTVVVILLLPPIIIAARDRPWRRQSVARTNA